MGYLLTRHVFNLDRSRHKFPLNQCQPLSGSMHDAYTT